MKQKLAMLLCGALFGVGLAVSDMINPARVIAFLDVTGKWDPTLMFVMGGALLVAFPLFPWILQRSRPRLASSFSLPGKTQIDPALIMGAILFGIGWGIGGICPGPALAQLAQPTIDTAIFLVPMLLGQIIALTCNA